MSNFIPIAVPIIDPHTVEAVRRQVASGWITMGPRVEELEELLAETLEVAEVIAVNNGTAALHTALIALGIKPGDEVLVPCLSYISSANAVLYCDAIPVFLEEDPLTYTVGPREIERRITPKTKAIIAVDLKGLPIDYDAIRQVADDHSLPLLADSAQSFGSAYRTRPVGSQALVHIFSMFANKTITSGEGGFITTNDRQIADTCRKVRNQGQSRRYEHDILGYNYRLTDVAATIAIGQVNNVNWVLEEKERIASFYTDRLMSSDILTPPHVPSYATRHSWFAYCITLDPQIDRKRMTAAMNARGIDYRLGFPPIPLQPLYRDRFGYQPGDFPQAESLFSRLIDIPCWAGMSTEQKSYVIDTTIKCAEDSYVAIR